MAAAVALASSMDLAGEAISQTPRGAVAETDRYRAEFTNGVLTSFVNKLTKEEYLNKDAKADQVIGHLPSGLGTQDGNAGRESARKLFEWPWWEHDINATWACQHYVATDSTVSFAAKDGNTAVVAYKGLTNGKDAFADETFALELAICPDTGDLLVTPSVQSPRAGVYGCGFATMPLAGEVTVEAPIFEGVRLDRHMQPKLWVNQWANFWDYAFVALNGEKTGAVGLWCQDKDLKFYKTLFYLINDQGLSLSVVALNVPPFTELKSAAPVTWRLQAFDKSWAQAAARFRDWRLKNVKIAPRPEWVKKLSFMEFGGDKAGAGNMVGAEKMFEGKDLDRVITWAPAVRGAGFDNNHSNNDPYPGFREDVKAWKAKGRKLMVYLQPMIMWRPAAKTDREKQAVELSKQANTRSPFRETEDVVDLTHDQHNLGHLGWQRWFLDWVKEYIQDYGCDGIYHDQSYACPIDARGANGMTSTQGMADYFFKAATENPNSIHGTEHMTEVNNVGASLGLGCGVLWGTPGYQATIGPKGSMNWQRIEQASPVSNSLHSPNGAIFGFPHQSNFPERGPVRFHHGMDQMEGRGDLPAIPCGSYWPAFNVPLDMWANDIWLDRQRAVLFVRNGLRPAFPQDWDRSVLSYFMGDGGADFRYERRPWGSAFVQHKDGKAILHYARITGVNQAKVEGAILGWPCWGDKGPAGLNPAVTYCVDGAMKRPAAFFSLAGEAFVKDGFANDSIVLMSIEPLDAGKGNAPTIVLHSAAEPRAVWVNGEAVKPAAAGSGLWSINVKAPTAFIVAVLKEPASGLASLDAKAAMNRLVEGSTKRDLFNPAAFGADLTQKGAAVSTGNRLNGALGVAKEFQTHIPFKAPPEAGVLKITIAKGQKGPASFALNGKPLTLGGDGIEIPLKAGELGVLSLYAPAASGFIIEWKAGK